jgi:prolipoprotein diacylglyceryltransferase
LGRIANFLNGELEGVPTENQNWGVIFPHVDDLFRHPSQLYESGKKHGKLLALEGINKSINNTLKELKENTSLG